jgi:hypothetical protein
LCIPGTLRVVRSWSGRGDAEGQNPRQARQQYAQSTSWEKHKHCLDPAMDTGVYDEFSNSCASSHIRTYRSCRKIRRNIKDHTSSSPFHLLPFSPFHLLPFSPFHLLPFSPFHLFTFSPFHLLPFSPSPLFTFLPPKNVGKDQRCDDRGVGFDNILGCVDTKLAPGDLFVGHCT